MFITPRLSIHHIHSIQRWSTRKAIMSKHARSPSQEKGLQRPSTKRAKEIDEHPPMEELASLLEEQTSKPSPRNVLHWFRSDIRMEDNRALDAASKKAKEGKGSLITCYLFSPKDMESHGTSPARSDFILESVRLLQKQLHEMHIPLAIITAEERAQKIPMMMDFVKKHNISHIYANFEYEINELRRDIKLLKRVQDEKDLAFTIKHDQTVIEPLVLRTGGGGPHKVFTPYHKAWLSQVRANPDLLNTYDAPSANDKSASSNLKELFDSKIPSLPSSKQFASKDEEKSIRGLWPAGHAAAFQRLEKFLKSKVKTYAADRSTPAKDASSRLSPYFATGVLSVRETLAAAKKANGGANFDGSGDAGIASWARELVFREFYRHVMVMTPHGGMNLPQNLKFDFVEWEDDEEGWRKWCDGTTGMPFVDAGMRQLNTEAYMHNRLRMNVASYLRTNLLIDYRRGERYFAEHLVDWDLCNNTQGWEPSYTVFNPVIQAEKCDKDGDFIRKWVPELKGVQGKAVFDPYHRLSKKEFEKLGYPKPHVDYAESKERALKRYKRDLAEADP